MNASTGYIHGFSTDEQDRLYTQARLLEPVVFDGVDFSQSRRVLEVGCGVGAQTEILLERFPDVRVQAVDRSAPQIARAREHLRASIVSGRASVDLVDAARLPFADGSFDGAFVCWVLEHMPDPVPVLREIRRVLRPGGTIFGIEVMNTSFSLLPACPAVLAYWNAYNRGQQAGGGDPFVGARAGDLLKEAGFTSIHVKPYPSRHDRRDGAVLTGRLEDLERLLVSAAPQLLALGLVNQVGIDRMRRELRGLRLDPRAVFYETPIKFSGIAAS